MLPYRKLFSFTWIDLDRNFLTKIGLPPRRTIFVIQLQPLRKHWQYIFPLSLTPFRSRIILLKFWHYYPMITNIWTIIDRYLSLPCSRWIWYINGPNLGVWHDVVNIDEHWAIWGIEDRIGMLLENLRQLSVAEIVLRFSRVGDKQCHFLVHCVHHLGDKKKWVREQEFISRVDNLLVEINKFYNSCCIKEIISVIEMSLHTPATHSLVPLSCRFISNQDSCFRDGFDHLHIFGTPRL